MKVRKFDVSVIETSGAGVSAPLFSPSDMEANRIVEIIFVPVTTAK